VNAVLNPRVPYNVEQLHNWHRAMKAYVVPEDVPTVRIRGGQSDTEAVSPYLSPFYRILHFSRLLSTGQCLIPPDVRMCISALVSAQ
jgi:hypothetical protein